jgi:hypothetical protein
MIIVIILHEEHKLYEESSYGISVQDSPSRGYFFSLRKQCSSEHPVLKHILCVLGLDDVRDFRSGENVDCGRLSYEVL